MKKLCLLVSVNFTFLFNVALAHAALFAFDDLPLPNAVIAMGTGTGTPVMLTEYNGFQFTSDNSHERVDAIDFDSFVTTAGPAYSIPYALTNNVCGNILITDIGGETFSFDSLFIKNWGGHYT